MVVVVVVVALYIPVLKVPPRYSKRVKHTEYIVVFARCY